MNLNEEMFDMMMVTNRRNQRKCDKEVIRVDDDDDQEVGLLETAVTLLGEVGVGVGEHGIGVRAAGDNVGHKLKSFSSTAFKRVSS